MLRKQWWMQLSEGQLIKPESTTRPSLCASMCLKLNQRCMVGFSSSSLWSCALHRHSNSNNTVDFCDLPWFGYHCYCIGYRSKREYIMAWSNAIRRHAQEGQRKLTMGSGSFSANCWARASPFTYEMSKWHQSASKIWAQSFAICEDILPNRRF